MAIHTEDCTYCCRTRSLPVSPEFLGLTFLLFSIIPLLYIMICRRKLVGLLILNPSLKQQSKENDSTRFCMGAAWMCAMQASSYAPAGYSVWANQTGPSWLDMGGFKVSTISTTLWSGDVIYLRRKVCLSIPNHSRSKLWYQSLGHHWRATT